MNILFIGHGLPPYHRDFLNRLNSVDGINLDYIWPKKEDQNMGAGVFQDESEIQFNALNLKGIEVPCKRLFGLWDFEYKPKYKSFKGLFKQICQRRPDIIIAEIDYHQLFRYDKRISKWIQNNGAKVIFHSIPLSPESFDDVQQIISTCLTDLNLIKRFLQVIH